MSLMRVSTGKIAFHRIASLYTYSCWVFTVCAMWLAKICTHFSQQKAVFLAIDIFPLNSFLVLKKIPVYSFYVAQILMLNHIGRSDVIKHSITHCTVILIHKDDSCFPMELFFITVTVSCGEKFLCG